MYKEYSINKNDILNLKKRRYVRQMLSRAITKKEIVRPDTCTLCSVFCNPVAHHKDYGKPLEIDWLCQKCHGLVHRKDHPWNPNNIIQSPLPECVQRNKRIHVSFSIPIANFIAICEEAEIRQLSLSTMLKEEILKNFPIKKNQLEFKFMEKNNDAPQTKYNKNISSMAKNEILLLQPQYDLFREIRGSRSKGN